MKRVMLFFIGIGTGGLLLYAFFLVALEPFAAAQTVTAVSSNSMEFPIYLSDGVCAVRLAAYDGPFLEDGTDDEMIGIAALELRNTSSQMIKEGKIVLYCTDRVLHFDFTSLPAGARMLVLEKDRNVYFRDVVLDCKFDVQQAPMPLDKGIDAQIKAPGYIYLANGSDKDYEGVRLHYKTYDSQSDMYVGGITYTAYAGSLKAGQSKSVTPYHVAHGHTQIVEISCE